MLQRTGYADSFIQALKSGMIYPIRDFENQKLEILSVATIGDIAVAYCGADIDLSIGAIKESAKLLQDNFAGVGIDEIREAFKLAASKKIDANLAAYSGQFTVRLFGDVMASYIEYRRPAVALIHQQIEIERQERELAVLAGKIAQAREAVVMQFKSIVAGSANPFTNYGDIPTNWCDILRGENLIFGDPATWIEAKRTVRERFMLQQRMIIPDDTLSAFDAKKAFAEMEHDETIFSNLLLPRAKVLYERLLIWKAITTSSQ